MACLADFIPLVKSYKIQIWYLDLFSFFPSRKLFMCWLHLNPCTLSPYKPYDFAQNVAFSQILWTYFSHTFSFRCPQSGFCQNLTVGTEVLREYLVNTYMCSYTLQEPSLTWKSRFSVSEPDSQYGWAKQEVEEDEKDPITKITVLMHEHKLQDCNCGKAEI